MKRMTLDGKPIEIVGRWCSIACPQLRGYQGVLHGCELGPNGAEMLARRYGSALRTAHCMEHSSSPPDSGGCSIEQQASVFEPDATPESGGHIGMRLPFLDENREEER